MAKRVTKRKSKTTKEKPAVIIGGQNASLAGGVNDPETVVTVRPK